jgi:hypothetical protein
MGGADVNWDDMMLRRNVAAAVDALINGREFNVGSDVAVSWSKQISFIFYDSPPLNLYLDGTLVASRIGTRQGPGFNFAIFWDAEKRDLISVIISLLNRRGITITIPGNLNEKDAE